MLALIMQRRVLSGVPSSASRQLSPSLPQRHSRTCFLRFSLPLFRSLSRVLFHHSTSLRSLSPARHHRHRGLSFSPSSSGNESPEILAFSLRFYLRRMLFVSVHFQLKYLFISFRKPVNHVYEQKNHPHPRHALPILRNIDRRKTQRNS